jgi:hypothetical protein
MKQNGVVKHMCNETKPEADDSSADESIGRPTEWREGRYEKAGMPKDESVVKKPGEAPPDTTSTTVTEKDYEEP